jgi:hypothetical protein
MLRARRQPPRSGVAAPDGDDGHLQILQIPYDSTRRARRNDASPRSSPSTAAWVDAGTLLRRRGRIVPRSHSEGTASSLGVQLVRRQVNVLGAQGVYFPT